MDIKNHNTTLGAAIAAVLGILTEPRQIEHRGVEGDIADDLTLDAAFRPHVVTLDREGKPSFTEYPESLRHQPLRIRSNVTINVLGDFVGYVNRFTGGNPPSYAAHLARQKKNAESLSAGAGLKLPQDNSERGILSLEFPDHDAPVAKPEEPTKTPVVAAFNSSLKDRAIIMITPDLSELKKSGQEVARAYLDYHIDHASPQRGQHQVVYVARPSTEYDELMAIDGKWHEQAAFAEVIKPLSHFCQSMASGHLVEMARTLALTANSEAQNIVNQNTGDTDIKFKVQTSATTQSTQIVNLTIPEQLTFLCPMLLGGAPVTLTAEFDHRIKPGQGVMIRLRFADRLHMENQALNAVADEILFKTGIQTLVGKLDVGSK